MKFCQMPTREGSTINAEKSVLTNQKEVEAVLTISFLCLGKSTRVLTCRGRGRQEE